MSRRAHSPLWVGAFVLAASASAAAEERPESIRVTYQAPDGCGSADEFFARLAERAAVRRVETAPRSFEVTITQDATGATHGELAIRTAAGDSVRAVDGASCAETMAAIVVVASLAVAAEREIRVVPVPVPVPSPPRERARPRAPWLAVGSGLDRYFGVAPDPVFAVPAFVAIGRRHRPQLRLGFARTARQESMLAQGASEFRWTVGRLDVRPFALAWGPLEVAPALGLEAGALTARGTQVGSAAGGSRPWVAPEVAARVGLHFARFALELEGVVAAPLVRDRFFIAPGITVHQVPIATAGVGLALIVEIL